MQDNPDAYSLLLEKIGGNGIDILSIKNQLKAQSIETPSWGYGNSGTRFKTFPWPGAARTIHEKLSDAAYINRITGIAPSVALHIPWDKTSDWNALKQFANSLGITLGAINPNLFQDDSYRLGSVCNPDASIRLKAIDHILECCQIMHKTGSEILSIWLADGTSYAGQDSIRERKHRLEAALMKIVPHLPHNSRMLIEYKFFEPAFYHTDIADWGMSYVLCQKLGEQAQVLVDMGHHAPGTNIAHIVAFLLDEDKLGGFHLNARHYADDDLIVGSTNPWELFVIYTELVAAGNKANHVAYMIDQSHVIEPKLEAMLISILNCQTAYAKALLVDYRALHNAQVIGDVLGAHQILADAFQTDVQPLMVKVRQEMDLPTDPIAYLRSDGYVKQIAQERSADNNHSGGYPE